MTTSSPARRVAALALVLAAALLAVPALASAERAPGRPGGPAEPPRPPAGRRGRTGRRHPPAHAGDRRRRRLAAHGVGAAERLAGRPRGRAAGPPLVYEQDGEVHLVPRSAQAYVEAGAVDANLFNITLLVQEGFDDRRGMTGRCWCRTPGRLPVVRALGAAAGEPRARPAQRGHGGGECRQGRRRGDVDGPAWKSRRPPRAGGSTGLRLDPVAQRPRARDPRRQRAAVGAPAAWEAGFDGTASRWRSSTPATTPPPRSGGPGRRGPGLHRYRATSARATTTATAPTWRPPSAAAAPASGGAAPGCRARRRPAGRQGARRRRLGTERPVIAGHGVGRATAAPRSST